VSDDGLKLTAYAGERDRVGDGFLADALVDVYARHGLRTSVVMRGVEGFGPGRHVHTDRLLTPSEDLPLVSVAVDARSRIEAALPEVEALRPRGLVTLERARLLSERLDGVEPPHEGTKLTVYVGRHERAAGRLAHEAIVDLLRRGGVAGASVLLGVDGTVRGARRRAAFFGRNAAVPLMAVAVGEGPRIARILPELGALLPRPLATLERVEVCKRDGVLLAEPRVLPLAAAPGLEVRQKLTVYAGEEAGLVRRLREAGAAGATSLRGIWGFHGDHAPHGDRLLQLRRRVPVVTVVIDTPERIRAWFRIVDEVTRQTGLVTSEMVLALRATGAGA
jgi:PII-like signaling protein